MTDIAELIHADHVRISKVLGQLDSALAEPRPAGTQSEADLVWGVLADFLRLHIAAAEEIAYLTLAAPIRVRPDGRARAGPGARRYRGSSTG